MRVYIKIASAIKMTLLADGYYSSCPQAIILLIALLAHHTSAITTPRKHQFIPQVSSANWHENELLKTANSGPVSYPPLSDPNGANDIEDKRTLSEQVSEGKYSLIDKELFSASPTRSGILSYDINPEVPRDNKNNLGGLRGKDIWLAEHHLLVLTGGKFGQGSAEWKAIDNYNAPRRPVKLPPHSKIPPPFPVQLYDNGPIQYVIPAYNHTLPSRPFSPFPQYPVPFGNFSYLPPPPPLIRPLSNDSAFPPPLYRPPPEAAFLPPFSRNLSTDAIDEDDPSLYYPPPYDFQYPKDNTTRVPPGPLVPGIVLPPPPDFFSALNNTNSEVSQSTKEQHANVPQYTKPGKFPENNEISTYDKATAKPITYSDIINEVGYPDADTKITYSDIEDHKIHDPYYKSAKGWIPIPAPKPYYITGPRKYVKDSILMVDTPSTINEVFGKDYLYEGRHKENLGSDYENFNGYIYDKPSKKFNYGFNQNMANSITSVSDTHPSTASPPTTISPAKMYHPPITSKDKSIQTTYYFYEEPQYFTAKELPVIVSSPKPINTLKPESISVPFVPPEISTHRPTIPVPSSEPPVGWARRPKAPILPIYYLAEVDKTPQVPSTTPPTYKQIISTFIPYGPTVTSTPKPYTNRHTPRPIFEYSYIAKGYRPSSELTAPPVYRPIEENRHQYQRPYTNFHFGNEQGPFQQSRVRSSTPVPIQLHQDVRNTFYKPVMPDTLSLERPWDTLRGFHRTTTERPFYATENPFYAFFTKDEEALVDENTKKYFTIFGQKIRKEESTVPSVQTTSSYSADGAIYNPTELNSRWTPRVKHVESLVEEEESNEKGGSSGETSTVSLEGDILVNYINPPSTPDPDSEYIDQGPTNSASYSTHGSNRNSNLVSYKPENQNYPTESSEYSYSSSEEVDDSKLISSSFRGRSYPINYKRSKFGPNPDNEPYSSSGYNQSPYRRIPGTDSGRPEQRPSISLHRDIYVNYREPRPPVNPEAEYVDGRKVSGSQRLVSYKIPGDQNSYLYFLTPSEQFQEHSKENNDRYDSEEKSGNYLKRASQNVDISVSNVTSPLINSNRSVDNNDRSHLSQ